MPDFSFQGIVHALSALLGQSQGEDAVTMLIADHRRVKEIFDTFKDMDDNEKMEAVQKALLELALHAACEEKLVYPAMREEGESEKEEVDEAIVEHHLVKVLMKELDAMSGVNDILNAKFKVLGELVQHHVEEEEQVMFPKMRSADDIDLQELGRQIAAKKEELLAKLGDGHDLGLVDPELAAHTNGNGNGFAPRSNGTGAKGKARSASSSAKKGTSTKKSGPATKATTKKGTAKTATGKKAAATANAKKSAAKPLAAKKKATVAKKATAKPSVKKGKAKPAAAKPAAKRGAASKASASRSAAKKPAAKKSASSKKSSR